MPDFPSIDRNPAVMDGKAFVRGTVLTVENVLSELGRGVSIDDLLIAHPALTRAHVMETIRYGAWLLSEWEAARHMTRH